MRCCRCPSDTTSAEWALIELLLPTPACETSRGGRPEKHPRREIVDAMRCIVDTGSKWRALPADFPPWRTVWGFVVCWVVAGDHRPRSVITWRAGSAVTWAEAAGWLSA